MGGGRGNRKNMLYSWAVSVTLKKILGVSFPPQHRGAPAPLWPWKKKAVCFKTPDLVLFCLLIFLQKNTFFTPYYSTWVWEGVVHIFLSLKKFCYVSSKLSSKSLKITTRKQNKLIRILTPWLGFVLFAYFSWKITFFFFSIQAKMDAVRNRVCFESPEKVLV